MPRPSYVLRRIIPRFVRRATRGLVDDALGIGVLRQRVRSLESLVLARLPDAPEIGERSRVRWLEARPDEFALTGGKTSGEDFVRKVAALGAFGLDKSVLEVGPGNGRLLRAILALKCPFKSYLGVDISPQNVAYLSGAFPSANIAFVQGDIEVADLGVSRFNLVISTLTFKHLYPSYERALCNLYPHLADGAFVVFDVPDREGIRWFEADGTAWARGYGRSECLEILRRASLKWVAFDKVDHSKTLSSLFVVATRTSSSQASAIEGA